MTAIPPIVGALIASYLLGSIPTAYLLVKWLKHLDVRTVGSGNVGATNVTRVAGIRAGVIVFLIDLSKGLLATRLIASWLLPQPQPVLRLACGVLAVLGHNFPLFLGFRGGKGVATTIGVLLGAVPLIAGVYLAVWGVVFWCCRYVSVGSCVAAVAIPLAQYATHRRGLELLLGSVLAALIIIRHRANIIRLIQGREPRSGPGRS